MRIKHENKLKMARRMMTPKEIKKNVSPFQSKAWEARRERNFNKQFKLRKGK